MYTACCDDSVFKKTLGRYNIPVTRSVIGTLQLNITKKCNQACIHCHVNAAPGRTEMMDKNTIDRILDLLSYDNNIHTVDITGGAPELNPEFRYLVEKINSMGKKIIDRCNLTVLLENGQEDTIEFLAQNLVHIIASMPCYTEENVNRQRGNDVYEKSISVLKALNLAGYGKAGSGLILDLVYNPGSGCLPGEQSMLEADYKQQLNSNYGIEFNNLLTMTNMPIMRFKEMLINEGMLESYTSLLEKSFNPQAASNVMCRELLSVAWNGNLYNCDFNQALNIPLKEKPQTIWDIADFNDIPSEISHGDHCFACTAGNGSSCCGALA